MAESGVDKLQAHAQAVLSGVTKCIDMHTTELQQTSDAYSGIVEGLRGHLGEDVTEVDLVAAYDRYGTPSTIGSSFATNKLYIPSRYETTLETMCLERWQKAGNQLIRLSL